MRTKPHIPFAPTCSSLFLSLVLGTLGSLVAFAPNAGAKRADRRSPQATGRASKVQRQPRARRQRRSRTSRRARRTSRRLWAWLNKTMLGQPLPDNRRPRRRKRRARNVQRTLAPGLMLRVGQTVASKPTEDASPERRSRSLTFQRSTTLHDSGSILQRDTLRPRDRRALHHTSPQMRRALHELPLTAQRIQLLMARNYKQIQYCYNRGLKYRTNQKGEIRVQLTIAPNGRATAVRFPGKKLNRSTTTCLKRTLQRWRFPKPKGTPVTVEMPLLFVIEG